MDFLPENLKLDKDNKKKLEEIIKERSCRNTICNGYNYSKAFNPNYKLPKYELSEAYGFDIEKMIDNKSRSK